MALRRRQCHHLADVSPDVAFGSDDNQAVAGTPADRQLLVVSRWDGPVTATWSSTACQLPSGGRWGRGNHPRCGGGWVGGLGGEVSGRLLSMAGLAGWTLVFDLCGRVYVRRADSIGYTLRRRRGVRYDPSLS